MRYINDIFTVQVGKTWSNETLLELYERFINRLSVDNESKSELQKFVQFHLVGQRTRNLFTPDLALMDNFEIRATTFEAGVNSALDALAAKIIPTVKALGITFDAIVTTTSSGNLMPGISYRMAHRLGALVQRNSVMLDLANVGCTGSAKALNIARLLNSSFKNILVLAIELPSTLVNFTSTRFDVWQGNCTFGDGAVAIRISSDPTQGNMALALEEILNWQWTDIGLNLISWNYRDYYNFVIADEKVFNRHVQQFVVDALCQVKTAWQDELHWAIHPAGITLLMRLSRKLGLSAEVIQPSMAHYSKFSNMSSVSIMHILREVAVNTPVNSNINLLTMGAGFNVCYGRIRKDA